MLKKQSKKILVMVNVGFCETFAIYFRKNGCDTSKEFSKSR